MATLSNLPFGTTPAILHNYLDNFSIDNEYDSPCAVCGEDTDLICDDCGMVPVCPAHSVEMNEHGVFYICLRCAKARGIEIRACFKCNEEYYMLGDICQTCQEELDAEQEALEAKRSLIPEAA